jgi:hypothetical protein
MGLETWRTATLEFGGPQGQAFEVAAGDGLAAWVEPPSGT